eukprot:2477826-Prymnesium_polylepis.1
MPPGGGCGRPRCRWSIAADGAAAAAGSAEARRASSRARTRSRSVAPVSVRCCASMRCLAAS